MAKKTEDLLLKMSVVGVFAHLGSGFLDFWIDRPEVRTRRHCSIAVNTVSYWPSDIETSPLNRTQQTAQQLFGSLGCCTSNGEWVYLPPPCQTNIQYENGAASQLLIDTRVFYHALKQRHRDLPRYPTLPQILILHVVVVNLSITLFSIC